MKKNIDKKINSLYKKKPAYVLTLGKDGKYTTKSISTIGTVKNIKVTKRESSGLVTEIVIEGSKQTVKIKSASYIRQILAPNNNAVVRQDEKEIEGLTLLPSTFFVIDKVKTDGSITGIKLTGGGYGHGVGMSQNGVKALVDNGYTYDQILRHYYNSIEIGYIY